MNNRRRILVALGGGTITASFASVAQQKTKVWRIGFLGSETAAGYVPQLETFRDSLKELGYVEGRNVVFLYRWAEGMPERLPQLADELLREKVDVLVTAGGGGVRAAHGATTTVPIVIASLGMDPISAGFVKSLARPGGNLTGVLSLGAALTAKQLELVKDALPNARNVESMVIPTAAAEMIKSMQTAAKSLQLDLQLVHLSGAHEFETAIAGMAERRIDALIVSNSPLFTTNHARIATLAARHRIPAFGTVRFADSGGLIGYGANLLNNYQRAAYFVDRIFKGAQPADLPIEQPSAIELVVNLKTAKAIGIRFRGSVMARAGRGILFRCRRRPLSRELVNCLIGLGPATCGHNRPLTLFTGQDGRPRRRMLAF